MRQVFGTGIRIGISATATMVVLAGCSGGGSKQSPGGAATSSPTGGAPATSNAKPILSEPMAHVSGGGHVDLLGLARTSADKVTAHIRVVDDGQQPLPVRDSLKDIGGQTAGLSANGLALLDVSGDKVYYPLSTNDGRCVCSDFVGTTVQPGKAVDAYAIFPAPPASVQRITLWTPITAPFADVPLGAGSVRPAPDQTIDPAKVPLGPPRIRSIISTIEGTDEATDDDDANRSVRLSADVLFATNKATLTPRARAVLQRLAGQIQSSTGNLVKIDGHTDNTGTDAINNPLSLRRAQAVQRQLQSLVTRQGITYQPAGHGSKQPVAENTTPQGRQQNRRVTVTFAKPPAPSTPAAPAPGKGTVFQWTGGKPPVIASDRLTAKNLKVDINSLHRDSAGLVTLVWTVTNEETSPTVVGPAFGKWNSVLYRGNSTAGATLVDTPDKLRYLPLRDQANVCLCTSFILLDSLKTLAPRQSVTLSDTYEAPADLTNVDVEIPYLATTSTIKNVAID